MKPVIDNIPVNVLKSELSKDRFVRNSNNGSNEIYIVTWNNAPNVVREIGRLREITFRAAGGGTGLDCDLDDYDTGLMPYEQLLVWNPEEEEITGGYRFIRCGDSLNEKGEALLATTKLFRFSEEFMLNYLPYTIELGRSFVQPKYQPSAENRRGLFTLDNLWDGLGAIIVDNPDIKYYFGKMTMYRHFNVMARDMLLSFMHYFFPDKQELVRPIHPLPVTQDVSEFMESIKGLDYKEAHKILNKNMRASGENIPPLMNSYMNLSSTMKMFGTALNDHFGEVEETAILVSIADIYETKKERHVNTYIKTGK
ncbi:MAG: GNAT family N-acetyltransferase [Bacteroidota bacterium]